jgi:hypothetical protein
VSGYFTHGGKDVMGMYPSFLLLLKHTRGTDSPVPAGNPAFYKKVLIAENK